VDPAVFRFLQAIAMRLPATIRVISDFDSAPVTSITVALVKKSGYLCGIIVVCANSKMCKRKIRISTIIFFISFLAFAKEKIPNG
jgi:hypothetical protein